ncbi:MAG: PD-(D/E)XK nuclease family protein, partial [Thermodesulfobacteriota bacterium]
MNAATTLNVAWSTLDWAQSIAALPADGRLPVRTVLVPNGRVAHALRRELLRTGRADALSGTLFRPLHLAAEDVLNEAAVRFTAGEEALRRARLATLFRDTLDLEYFDPELLRTARGWEDAFASTIADLEAAGLRPDDLAARQADAARVRDVAAIWRRLDALAGASWTTARIVSEAAARLEAEPRLWPHEGPVLAPAAGDLTNAAARFLRAIPSVHLVVLAARPLRQHHLERVELLLGHDVRHALEAAAVTRRGGCESEILASYLFEPGDVLGDPSRPRSSGPDGTAHLEEHAGVEDEVDAAARWVAREVMERGTPLEDVAVLLPARDHVLDLVAARLASLPWKDGERFPVFVAGGTPLVSFAGGAHALAVVRALRRHLAAESLVPVLTALKLAEESGAAPRRLSHERAMEIAYGLGTLGGNPAHPLGALDWSARLEARATALEARVGSADGDDENDREQRDAKERLAAMRALREPLFALTGVARRVADGEPLDAIWHDLRAFLSEHVVLDVGRFDVVARLADALEPLCADTRCASLAGADALACVEDVLLRLRVPSGRFGDPAVYVGTVDGARGLPFTAVRVIGLLEGALPAQAHEDPVLPDVVRAGIPGIARIEDRSLAQLHALDRVVRDARRIVLSAPRLDGRRVEREASSVFIEAAAALGRPDALTGEALATPVPDARALQRDAFAPARRDADAHLAASPLLASDWLQLVARGGSAPPSAWRAGGALDLARILALRAPDAPVGPLDGILGHDAAVRAALPGLSAERPTSASALKTALECPHRFLLERVLYLTPPAPPCPTGEVDALAYGGLFHEVVEEIYAGHGERICAREHDLEHWRRLAHEIASRRFAELLETYPLVGPDVREQQLARLRRDLDCFLEYEWTGPARAFRRVELPFGYPEPVRIDLDDGTLYVRGYVDRVDVEDGRTLVRDLKTGKAHPRTGKEAAADHRRDVQLALYGMVLRQSAA